MEYTAKAIGIIQNLSDVEIAVTFLSIVFFGVLVRKFRQAKGSKTLEGDDVEVMDPYPLDSDEKPSFAHPEVKDYLKKITPGEYEYQATVYTRAEIQKLT